MYEIETAIGGFDLCTNLLQLENQYSDSLSILMVA